jgi:hypothetical protein
MKIVGCDLHTRYQQIALLDEETGELVERRLEHASGEARAFYASAWTGIVYAPDGFKFAKMQGQTVSKYMAPLGGGLQAVYTAATPAAPAYWRHSDWLGSSRIASTPAQTVYYDGMYAPFGESYNETGTTDRSFTGQTQDTG